MNEKEIMETRAALVEELEALNKTVGEEKRQYTDEESAKADELIEKIRGVDAMAEKLAEQRAVIFANKATAMEKNVEVRSYGEIINDFVRGNAAPEYRANETTLGNNSSVKMSEFSEDIIKKATKICPIINEVTTVVSAGTYKQIVQNEDYKASGDFVAEGGSFAVTESRWTTKTIDKYKYGSTSVITLEMIYEAAFDVLPEIEQQFTLDFAKCFEKGSIAGSGTGQPEGLLTGGTVKTLSNATVKADDIVDIYHAIAPTYYTNAKWVMNNNTLCHIRKLKDGTGQYLFHQEELTEGYAGTILGKPVLVSEEMPDIGTGKKPILFGDFRRAYKCVRSPEITITVLRELYSQIGAIGIQGILWFGGAPVNNDAYITASM
jgi:HK97 family phage major capsid protein